MTEIIRNDSSSAALKSQVEHKWQDVAVVGFVQRSNYFQQEYRYIVLHAQSDQAVAGSLWLCGRL
jgi:hypothetical protein